MKKFVLCNVCVRGRGDGGGACTTCTYTVRCDIVDNARFFKEISTCTLLQIALFPLHLIVQLLDTFASKPRKSFFAEVIFFTSLEQKLQHFEGFFILKQMKQGKLYSCEDFP